MNRAKQIATLRAVGSLKRDDPDAAVAFYRNAIETGGYYEALATSLLRLQSDPDELMERLAKVYVEAFGPPPPEPVGVPDAPAAPLASPARPLIRPPRI